MRSIHTVEIKDDAAIGAARRAVHRFADEAGFNETELAELDIVAQEIGTNAVRYASGGGGVLHFAHPFIADAPEQPGIELFYWDKGPGIYDTEAVIRDCYSTGGSLGFGFGAIRRLTDEFDIYSTVQSATGRLKLSNVGRTTHGTALLCRKLSRAKTVSTESADASANKEMVTRSVRRIGTWTRARSGENANGDAFFVRKRAGQMLLAVIDGLGHGSGAQEAAHVALDVLEEWRGEPPDEIVNTAHAALRSTRGAVIGLALIDTAREQMQYAGVGNTSARVFNAPQPVHPISTNGTLGARLGKLPISTYPWSDDATIVMTTDGVSAKWDIAAYPGLLQKDSQLLAGVLMRDYGRSSDDATILVAR